MAEENRGDDAAQAAELATLLKDNGFESVSEMNADRLAARAERDKFNGNNDEARTIIQSKASEIDQLRRDLEAEKAKGKETPKPTEPPKEELVVEETLDEIKARLTPEQLQAADAAYKALPDVGELSKRTVADSVDLQKKIFTEAAQVATVVPESLLDPVKTETKTDDLNERIKAMFTIASKENRYVPPGPNGGPSQTQPTKPESKRLHVGTDGILSALKDKQT